MDYKWKESRHGLWERDIDELETFYASVAKIYQGTGRMFFAITGHVSLTVAREADSASLGIGKKMEDALRQAWIRIRRDHPTIAAVVEYDLTVDKLKKRYEALIDDKEHKQLDAWVHETFQVISNGQDGNTFANADPPAPKLPTLFVVAPENNISGVVQRDIVFRSPHDIIDGVGTLYLLQKLICHAAEAYNQHDSFYQINFGDEAANLSPCFRRAAEISGDLSPRLQKRFSELMTAMKSTPKVKVAGLPFKEGVVVPGKHQRVARTLSEEKTSNLIKKCRSFGATVTHAYHAAIAMSMRDLQQQTNEAHLVCYKNYILRNERSRCVYPYNTPQHAVSCYHSVSGEPLIIELTVPAAGSQNASIDSRVAEFIQVLTEMKEFYHTVNNDADHLSLVPHFLAATRPSYPKECVNSSKFPPIPPPAVSAAVSISSMGLVDRIISADGNKPFQVYDPWVTGEELRNGLGLFLGTFRGELCLSAAYNDAWHDEDEVREYLERCERIVMSGLGLI